MTPLESRGACQPSAGDVIRALVCGYPTTARAIKLMVMLRAFVDDSAGETGDRRLFLAGFINDAEKWAEFSDAWAQELHHPPSIAACHMVEAQNRRGEFKGWTEADRDAKLLSLAKIIRRYNPWSVHCSVSRNEYDTTVAPVTVWPFKNPYFACFIGIITAASQYHEYLGFPDAPAVDFVFDDQQGLGEQALIWHSWLKKIPTIDCDALWGQPPYSRPTIRSWPYRRPTCWLGTSGGYTSSATKEGRSLD